MEHLTCQIKTNRTWKKLQTNHSLAKYEMIYYLGNNSNTKQSNNKIAQYWWVVGND